MACLDLSTIPNDVPEKYREMIRKYSNVTLNIQHMHHLYTCRSMQAKLNNIIFKDKNGRFQSGLPIKFYNIANPKRDTNEIWNDLLGEITIHDFLIAVSRLGNRHVEDIYIKLQEKIQEKIQENTELSESTVPNATVYTLPKFVMPVFVTPMSDTINVSVNAKPDLHQSHLKQDAQQPTDISDRINRIPIEKEILWDMGAKMSDRFSFGISRMFHSYFMNKQLRDIIVENSYEKKRELLKGIYMNKKSYNYNDFFENMFNFNRLRHFVMGIYIFESDHTKSGKNNYEITLAILELHGC